MDDHDGQQRSIQGEAKICRDLLADIMSHLSQHDPLFIGVELQDEMGRFNLWAANIGVFASLHASLDFRLIDVPEIKTQFLRQLDILNITLLQLKEKGISEMDEDNEDIPTDDDASAALEHEITELVQSIHLTIDWLHRLSNLVRKASFANQNQRAAMFPLRDEVGNDLTECMSDLFRYFIKRDCSDITENILDRLVETMIIRRRRILYRRSRQRHYALEQEKSQRAHLDPPVQLPPVEEVEEPEEEEKGDLVTEEVVQSPTGPLLIQPTPSRITVTTVDRGKYQLLAAPSGISRATTVPFQHDEKILVPPRPQAAKDGKEFICDYCCLILQSREAADRDRWADHVKKDLDPYICVFDDCSQPYRIYSSSREWLAHIRGEHRMSWRCVVRDHPPRTFDTQADFISHMTDDHPGKFRREQLAFIAESSARALSPTIPACPFCSQDSGDLESHVAQHLCHFALLSLPWPDYLDNDSDAGSMPRTKSSTSSQEGERTTVIFDLDDKPSSVVDDFLDKSSVGIDSNSPPLLDTPISWSNFTRQFPEPDAVLNDFAEQVAKRSGKEVVMPSLPTTTPTEMARNSAFELPRPSDSVARVWNPTENPTEAHEVSSLQETPHPFFMQRSLKTGSFELVDSSKINSAIPVAEFAIGDAYIESQLLVQRSQFGTLGDLPRLPAGIIYMEVYMITAKSELETITITISIDDEDPHFLLKSDQNDPSMSSNVLTRWTEYYGPAVVSEELLIPRKELPPYKWKLFGERMSPIIDKSGNRTIRWQFTCSKGFSEPIRVKIRLGCAFKGSRPFFLRTEVDGRLARISDRIRSGISRSIRNKKGNGRIFVNHLGGDGTSYNRALDTIAMDLPSFQECVVEPFKPIAGKTVKDFSFIGEKIQDDKSGGVGRDIEVTLDNRSRDREASDEYPLEKSQEDGGSTGGSSSGVGPSRTPQDDKKEKHIAFVEYQRNNDSETLHIPGPRDVELRARPTSRTPQDDIETEEQAVMRMPEFMREEGYIAFIERQRKEDGEVLRIPGPRDFELGARPTRVNSEDRMQ